MSEELWRKKQRVLSVLVQDLCRKYLEDVLNDQKRLRDAGNKVWGNHDSDRDDFLDVFNDAYENDIDRFAGGLAEVLLDGLELKWNK